MPNWCECSVKLKGANVDKVHSLLQSNGLNNQELTMRKLIPQPFDFIDSDYAYMITKDEYKNKCNEFHTDYYNSSIYGTFFDYLNKVDEKGIKRYDKANMLDKAVYNFNWRNWRNNYWGVKWDIYDVFVNEVGLYKYYTPWKGNIKFWKSVSEMYKLSVEILEEESSDSLFAKTTIKDGIITRRVIYDNEVEFRRGIDNLTDKETAELILELYDSYEELEEYCNYIYLIEKYLKLIDTKAWKLK